MQETPITTQRLSPVNPYCCSQIIKNHEKGFWGFKRNRYLDKNIECKMFSVEFEAPN